MPTVAACYCTLHRISPDRFATHCLARMLYPHARLVRPLLLVLRPGFFDADLDLIRAIGALRSPRPFSKCCADYRLALFQAGFTRRDLRLRLSLRRLYRLVADLTTPDDPQLQAPMGLSDRVRSAPPSPRSARRSRPQPSLSRL